MAGAQEFEPDAASQGQDVSWYDATPKSIDASTRQLLETYSHVEPDRVEQHIIDVRNRAFKIFQYPCLGQFRFLDLSIGKAPQYAEVLQRVKDGETLLDLGCCLGQDLRRLVADGAPSDNLIGSDLERDFTELGYDLFLDRDSFKGTFVAADMTMDPSAANSPLHPYLDKISTIHASSFFHLFDYPTQLLVAKNATMLLKKQKGSMIFGRQVGNVEAGNKLRSVGQGVSVFRHNEESFKKMWEEIGEATGTRWDVEIELTDAPGWTDKKSRGEWDSMDGIKRIRYAVRMR